MARGRFVSFLTELFVAEPPSVSWEDDGAIGEEIRLPPGLSVGCAECGESSRTNDETIVKRDVRFEIITHEVEGGCATAGVPVQGFTVTCIFCGDGVFLTREDLRGSHAHAPTNRDEPLLPSLDGEAVALPAGIAISCSACGATNVTVDGTKAIRHTQLNVEIAMLDDEEVSVSDTAGCNVCCTSCGAIVFLAHSKLDR